MLPMGPETDTSSALPPAPAGGHLTIAVGIATSGRALILRETLARLAGQTLPPAAIIVLYGKPEDIGGLHAELPNVRFMAGHGGLCDKRNVILEAAASYDIILFLDDDFLLAPGYLSVMQSAFYQDPSLAAATGTLLADGIKGPGLTLEQASRFFEMEERSGHRRKPPQQGVFNTYGCNMAFRMDIIRKHGLHFDPLLPAYGWYEDIDFSRRINVFGATRMLRDARGVHMGAKVGRISGRRLGYSQIANPVYLWRKGTLPASHMVLSMSRNVLANLARFALPEPYIDRRGRMRGNLLAFRDLLCRRAHPTRILEMQ